MNIIKKITKGNFTLEHSWYVDEIGLQRNSFVFIKNNEDGSIVKFPFMGGIRVETYSRDDTIKGDNIKPFTDEEYEQMFDEHLKKVS